ncbi:MAG: efflux RND transporter periplasmic adaptor subunit [Sterolibacterium sp.]|nr:efflux RND transporter periplasmic adaptor subunit [Sterolibacterium sp.]
MRNLNLLTLGIAVSVSLTGCSRPEPVAESIRPALVIRVQANPDADRAVYTGEVRARHEADLAFRIAGKLVSRQVDVGSRVGTGDVLARLDPADSALNADAARAQAAAGETEYLFAKAELDRYSSLREKNFISQAAYDAKLNAFSAARARFEQARSQASLAGNQAAYAALHADHAGVITAIYADPGQVVGAGQVVMKLARPEEKEVVVAVAENRLAELRAASEASIRLWAEPGKTYRGKVREIAPNADAMTRTFAVKVSMLEVGPVVRLGMTASVMFMGTATPSVLLPLAAVTQKEGQALVWVVEGADNKVAPRPVTIGEYGDNGVPILSGLSVGERVVVAGVHKLLPGQVVRPLMQATALKP